MSGPAQQQCPDECVICFNAPAKCAPLPCACRHSYCQPCWERALYQSLFTSGESRCPTCRTPVSVSFDAYCESLLFALADATECYIYETVERLAYESLPAQIDSLRRHGASMGQQRRMTEGSSEQTCDTAPCVCGAWLVRQDASERQREYAEQGHDSIICDICGDRILGAGDIWSCEAGCEALLHVTGYDVCNECFQAYTSATFNLLDDEPGGCTTFAAEAGDSLLAYEAHGS